MMPGLARRRTGGIPIIILMVKVIRCFRSPVIERLDDPAIVKGLILSHALTCELEWGGKKGGRRI
jgi:hypothetical protein